MKERIRELAEQAGSTHKQNLGVYQFYSYELEKFAELIIAECVQVCNKIYFDRYPDAEDYERSEEGDAIKRHFGVEP